MYLACRLAGAQRHRRREGSIRHLRKPTPVGKRAIATLELSPKTGIRFYEIRFNPELTSASMYYNDASYPPELKRVVDYYREIQTVAFQTEEKRLAYLESWNPADLTGMIGKVDVGKACSMVLEELAAAPDRKSAYELVLNKWRNCVNDTARREVGPFPQSEWEQFLRAHSITEKYLVREVD
jgi:hypothetical protein